MNLIIDTASITEIKEIMSIYPCDGVTTNPTILAKTSSKAPYETLKEIREFIKDKELHVQVISKTASDIVQEAKRITSELGKDTYVKIPVNEEGLKAIRMCKEIGIKVTATAVYTQMQAFLAAKAKADYCAPYINRIDNLGANGINTTKQMYDMLQQANLPCKILAASFKNTQQVVELLAYGIQSVTCSSEVIHNFLKNQTVDSAISVFRDDFEKVNGKDKTMFNI